MNYSVKSDEGIVTSTTPCFLDPDVVPPPKGVDMLVMTKGGVLTKSHWMEGAGFLAWYALPKAPPWLKAKLNAEYTRNIEKAES